MARLFSFAWLKTYMPRSLYGRAAIIVLAPVVLLQLVISVSFVQRHYEGVTRQMSRSVALELRLLAQEVSGPGGLAEAQRVALMLDMTLIAVPSAPAADRIGWLDLPGRAMAEVFAEEVPSLQAVDLSARGDVVVWLRGTEAELVQVSLPRRRVTASNPHQLLVLIVVLGTLLSIVAYLFLRNQLRPIARLSAAATEFGRGRVVRFTPSGATEVRTAGAAFLDMRNRIERQNQTRTLMLSGVSHDLRTPLTRMKLGLAMMDEAEAAPMLRDVADMERMISGFLDFARGDTEDERVPTDGLALLRNVVADARRAGQAVEEGEVPDPGTVLVELRPMALRRALDNLIGNALRYGTRARLSLVVGDRSLRFTVEDDGPGIPPERRDEAMRPFARLDEARNQDGGPSVGLGLAIVADIARAHGGTLRLAESARLGGLRADIVLAR